RNAWLIVTVVALLSTNFLLIAVAVTAVSLYVRVKHAATVPFFFIVLFAVPLVGIPIGGFGLFNMLFDINNARLLAIVLLLPSLLLASQPRPPNRRTFVLPDLLVIGYVMLQVVLQIDQSNVTQIMRTATLQSLDVLIPYFAFSRGVVSADDFRKV